ncbi:MAG: ATP-binding protein [Lachnospiraceae bacterium]|jgi:predicted AAA+ superfamily ATPase|nr:ATP-binding protein [Lachnospiraceae bacterium]
MYEATLRIWDDYSEDAPTGIPYGYLPAFPSESPALLREGSAVYAGQRTPSDPMALIGREREIRDLEAYVGSGRPEFLALHGRRRVGKTFLIRSFFRNRFTFYCTGLFGGKKADQLRAWNAALNRFATDPFPLADNWFDAFLQLERCIGQDTGTARKVIFIDEMPWLDTHGSGFLTALEYFWNSFASARQEIFLIACGSAASWIVKKLFRNTGGLYNRVTRRMVLKPFTLRECEMFFHSRGVVMNRYQMLESYMVFGGIPFYMDMFLPEYGLAQNIDMLCFGENPRLAEEYGILFASLFGKDEHHRDVVNALSQKAVGLTRDEIIRRTGIPNGGRLTETLEGLEQCGLLRRYMAFGKKSRDALYQLNDHFTLFYHRFLKDGQNRDSDFWTHGFIGGAHRAWSGYAFEMVCLNHEEQIRRALGILGVSANIYSWHSTKPTGTHANEPIGPGDPPEPAGAPAHPQNHTTHGAQVDMVIDRADQIINLCEMKYSLREFEIDAAYAKQLQDKLFAFAGETKTRKALHLTLITTYGLRRNPYSSGVSSQVTMKDLFA